MKVNLKNNRLMHRLVMASICGILFVFILAFNYPQSYILLFFIAVIPVMAVWYLISILQFLTEPIAIQTPFSMYLATSIFALILPFLSSRVIGSYYFPIGAINIVLIGYMILKAFRVKNQQFSNLFKLYTIALFIVVLSKFSVFYLSPYYSTWLFLADVLPLFIVIRIINKTGKLLQTETGQVTP